MPAPKNPNVGPANAARAERANRKAASKLTERGWLCLNPTGVEVLTDALKYLSHRELTSFLTGLLQDLQSPERHKP